MAVVGENKVSLDVVESQCTPGVDDDNDYSQRAQWLRAAVLGANDGLLSTAFLMMGVGAVKDDTKAMLVSGMAELVAGACSMAIGEFVSVYSQLDMEIPQLKRQQKSLDSEGLPRPLQAAAASALAFSAGAAGGSRVCKQLRVEVGSDGGRNEYCTHVIWLGQHLAGLQSGGRASGWCSEDGWPWPSPLGS